MIGCFRVLVVLAMGLSLVLSLVGCTAVTRAAGGAAVAAVTGGGGPKVAANVQAGKSNVQSAGRATVADQRLIKPQARTIEQSAGDTQVRTERVETVVVRNDAPFWVWGLLILGWVVPTPGAIWRKASARLRGWWRKL